MQFGCHFGCHVVHFGVILVSRYCGALWVPIVHAFGLSLWFAFYLFWGHCWVHFRRFGAMLGTKMTHFGVCFGFTFVILGPCWAPKWRPNRHGDSFGDLWLPQAAPWAPRGPIWPGVGGILASVLTHRWLQNDSGSHVKRGHDFEDGLPDIFDVSGVSFSLSFGPFLVSGGQCRRNRRTCVFCK